MQRAGSAIQFGPHMCKHLGEISLAAARIPLLLVRDEALGRVIMAARGGRPAELEPAF